jgi:hypothetical protein
MKIKLYGFRESNKGKKRYVLTPLDVFTGLDKEIYNSNRSIGFHLLFYSCYSIII